MRAFICDSAGIDSFLDELADVGQGFPLLCYIGPPGPLEDALELTGQPEDLVFHLGPNETQLTPACGWGWVLASLGCDEIAARCSRSDLARWRRGDATADGAPLPLVVEWSQCLESMTSLRFDGPGIAGDFATGLETAELPSVMNHARGVLLQVVRSYSELLKRLFLSPNALTWSEALSVPADIECAGLRLSPQIQALDRAVAALRGMHGFRDPGLLRALRPLVSSPRRHINVPLWQNSLRVWSALLYVRSEAALATGLNDLSFALAWRSLETYAYLAGLREDVLSPRSGGNWSWGPRGGPPSSLVTTQLLFDYLDTAGVQLVPPAAARPDEQRRRFRQLRNASLVGHGTLSLDVDGCRKALRITRETIQADDTTGGPWQAFVRAFRSWPAFGRLPEITLAQVVGESAVRRLTRMIGE